MSGTTSVSPACATQPAIPFPTGSVYFFTSVAAGPVADTNFKFFPLPSINRIALASAFTMSAADVSTRSNTSVRPVSLLTSATVS